MRKWSRKTPDEGPEDTPIDAGDAGVRPDTAETEGSGSDSSALVSGPLTFGDPAALQAAPIKLAAQPSRLLEHVPDTALDWLETPTASMRAVSARGRLHRHLGEAREDSFALAETEGHLVLAVADGVGNAPASHVGSAIAARMAVLSPGTVLPALMASESGTETLDLRDVSAALAFVAADREIPPLAVSTTLLLAAIRPPDPGTGETRVTLVQLGDSLAFRLRSRVWERLGPSAPQDEEDVKSTATVALPEHTQALIWTDVFRPGETLALTSDGVSEAMAGNVDYAASLALLWESTAPAPNDLLRVIDATVKSYDDDRTFMGVRFSGSGS
jgi:serine/threonine protein phosphatase PrpC